MAEKYYSISPYIYCAGSPVNLVDPDGEDYYFLFHDGTIVFGYNGEENEDDYLIWGEIAENEYGPTISLRVSDKTILKALSQSNENRKENISHSVKSVSSELIDVFDFVIHHSSSREWAIASFTNNAGVYEYGLVQGRRGSAVSSPTIIQGLDERNMIAKIHTHEGYIQNPGGSGYIGESRSFYPSDRTNYNELASRLLSQGYQVPPHYVYEVPNGYIGIVV